MFDYESDPVWLYAAYEFTTGGPETSENACPECGLLLIYLEDQTLYYCQECGMAYQID